MQIPDERDIAYPHPQPSPRVVSLHRSDGGVPKLAIPVARITFAGVEGDRQRNLEYHGGPDRALCLYSHELIGALQAEGHPIAPGSMGENVVIAGIDWREMVSGVALRLGTVEVELTAFAAPCRNIRASFLAGRIGRVSSQTHRGLSRMYAKVRKEGILSPNDPVAIL